MAGSFVSQWGEGPAWVRNALYYVDIEGRKLLRLGENGEVSVLCETDFLPSALVPCSEGGFLCAGQGGIYSWDGKGNPVFRINPESGQPDHRLNDGRCSPDGFFFVGSLSPRRLPDASLFRYDREGQVSRVLSGVGNSNGMAWSMDGSEVFYIDTVTRAVSRFDYKRGIWSNRRTAFSTSAFEASPDGMAISTDGTLWIALCHAGCVAGFSPDGRILERIDLPCREVSACAFGGAGLDILYVTTGCPSSDREETAGRLFAVEGLGVKGMEPYAFG